MLVSERVGQFFVDDHRLEFTEYGAGDRWVVLVHGLLMPRRMHQPLARALAASGLHVLTLDLLGHGRSDRPDDPQAGDLSAYGDQVVALLDHLTIDRAVVGGTSLGANVALEVAVTAPDRVAGLIVEMPVLENSLGVGLATFGPLLAAARLAPLGITGLRWATRMVPRGVVPFWAGVVLDTLGQRPGPMAATLHGLFFGRIAPPARLRRQIEAPALVIGHSNDPVHAHADAEMLALELVDVELVEARSILEWRFAPERLDAIAVDFALRCTSTGAPARRLSTRG